jgi:UDP-N-acetylglucosamine 1-carboxyvinyltransferase
MDDAYIVNGGRPLKGEVQLSGAKNVALNVIIASLLFENEVCLSNIPKIKDIEELLLLIRNLGGKAEFIDKNKVIVSPRGIHRKTIDLFYASKTRVSFMLFAPLLNLFGQAKIPNPGGCRIGARPIDRQIELMKVLAVDVVYNSEDGYYQAKLKNRKIKGDSYSFDKPSHTGTEFAIMLGCLADGEIVVDNASQEPEIDDLIHFLNESGAKIKREKNKICICGVKKLVSQKENIIKNDRNEAVTYAVFALATGGKVDILGIEAKMIDVFIKKVREIGGKALIGKERVRFYYDGELKASNIVTQPHPGFMTDWQAPWAVLMTQADGISTIHETVFENRFSYVAELKKLGAKIDYFQPEVKEPEKIYQFNCFQEKVKTPQAIKIYGRTKLHNAVLQVLDLRAGASLLIAASCASGESVVNGASVIERGYENIDKKLRNLGLKIKKI